VPAKKSEKAASKAPRKSRKKKTAEVASRGLPASEIADAVSDGSVAELTKMVETDGGSVIGVYRDPLGSHPLVLASLPIEKVEPTPFQRDLSAAHVNRLAHVIDALDLFLDPIVAVRGENEMYWTPNGNHRLHAMKSLGAKSVIVLLNPDRQVAYRILALNTEKAHNLREKSLEVIRMARSLASVDDTPESRYAIEFEEPAFLTLGACYEKRGRFSGSSYHSILRRVDQFMDEPLRSTLELRDSRAARLVEVDDAVGEAVKALKAKGFDSPYLKAFVIARINPIRFKKGEAEFDDVVDKMLAAAQSFDAGKVKQTDVARAAGPPDSGD
jgi:ParB family chromosome partitioning protein